MSSEKNISEIKYVIGSIICTILCISSSFAQINVGDEQNFNTRYDGPQSNSRLGQSLTYGDVNGDGYLDLIVGAYRNSANGRLNSGSVYIILGKATSPVGTVLDLDNSQNYDIRFDGEGKKDQLGRSVACGDINNDNFDDIIIGANGSNNGGKLGAGSVYVIYGSSTIANQKNKDLLDHNNFNVRYDGALNNDRLGEKVLSLDVNGDGYEDVIMSAALANNDSSQDLGSVYITFGNGSSYIGAINALSDPGTFSKVYTGTASGDSLGASLAGGDINGDGFADLMIGAPYQNSNTLVDNGSLYVIYGKDESVQDVTLSLSNQNNYNMRFDGYATNDVLGLGAACTDYNGDGLDDIIIGAPGTDFHSRTRSGSFYLINGSTSPPATKNIDLGQINNFNIRFDGAANDELLGINASSNDINGDGLHDLLLGSYFADYNDSTNSGSVYVLYGNDSYTTSEISDLEQSSNYDLRYDGARSGDNFGRSTSGVDFNADGFGDIVSSAYLASDNDSLEFGSVYHILTNTSGEPGAIKRYLEAGDRPDFIMRDEGLRIDFSEGSDGSFNVQRKHSKPSSDYVDNTGTVSWLLSSDKGSIKNTQVSLHYNIDQVAGLDTANLAVFYRKKNGSLHDWYKVNNTVRSHTSNTFKFTVDSLGEFTLGDRDNISNHYPYFVTTDVDSATEDQSYLFTLVAKDTDNDNLTYIKLNGPQWVSVSLDGILSGTPDLNDIGTTQIEIKVTDDGINTLSDTLLTGLTVIEVNDKPQFITTSIADATEDSAYIDTVLATDEESSVLVYSALAAPGWMNVAIDGVLSGTPENSDVATNIPVKVIATDEGGASDTLQTTINVFNTNDAPVLSSIPGEQIDEGSQFSNIDLKQYTTDVDNSFSELNWTISNNPNVSVTIDFDGIATLTPNNKDWNGTDSIQFKVTDPGGLSDSTGALFMVKPVNDPPVVSTIPNQTIDEGGSFSDINLNDFVNDVDNADSVITWSYKNNGELIVTIDQNKIAHISPPDSNWFGFAHIHFHARDPSGAADSTIVDFTINNIPDAPLMSVIPSQNIPEGNAFDRIALDNYVEDVDTPKENLSWSYSGNSALIVSIDSQHRADVTPPDSNWFGEETVIFKVTDPDDLSDQTSVLFSVSNVNDAPVFITVSIPNATEDIAYQYQLSASDIDDNDLTYSAISIPAWMTLSISGLLNGTPSATDIASNQDIIVAVSDPHGSKDTLTTQIDILAVNDAPMITGIPDIGFNEDDSVLIDLLKYADDEESPISDLVFTVNIIAASGFNTTIRDGHFAHIVPDSNVYGNFHVRFTVTDPQGLSASDTVQLTIRAVNDAPVINPISSIRFAEDTSYFLGLTPFISDVDDPVQSLHISVNVLTGQGLLFTQYDSVQFGIAFSSAENVFGAFSAEIVVSDQEPLFARDTFVVNVSPVNDPPQIAGVPDFSFNEDDSITVDLLVYTKDNDNAMDELTFRAQIADGETRVAATTINKHFIKFVPKPNIFGNFTVNYSVTDPLGLSGSDSAYIRITSINDPPVFLTSTLPKAYEDKLYSDTLLVSDVDGNSFTFTRKILPGWMDLSAIGIMSGIPKASDIGNAQPIFITVSDGISEDTLITRIDVVEQNDPPVIKGIPDITINEDESISLDLAIYASDEESPLDSLAFYAEVLDHPSFTIPIEDGHLAFIAPEENLNGSYFARFSVADPQGLTGADTVRVNILAVNDPPVLSFDDEIQIVNDTPVVINLTDGVTDIDNDSKAMTWSFYADTSVIILGQFDDSLSINAPGLYGGYKLYLTAKDPGGLADSAVIKLSVTYPESKYDKNGDGIPESVVMFQNFPNPFSANTVISYGIPNEGPVKVEIYNSLGQKITTLFNGSQAAGFHKIRWNAQNISSGIYFYRVLSPGKNHFSKILKMLIVQ